jgi:mono/diheme cytochrome c family protein
MKIRKTLLLICASLTFMTLQAQNNPNAEASAANGKLLYEQNCLACHQVDGSGVPYLAPPLSKGVFVTGEKKRLIEIVLNGMQDVEIKGQSYSNPMPSFDYLADTDIADVLTFVRSNFKNKEDAVLEADVKDARKPK